MDSGERGLVPISLGDKPVAGEEARDLAALDSALLIPPAAVDLGQTADQAIEEGRFEEAREASLSELRVLLDQEKRTGRRLHKGHPLYNIGVVDFARDPATGRRYIIAAHVEDARTWPYRRPKATVAARVLTDLFKFPTKLAAALGRVARGSQDFAVEVAHRFERGRSLPSLPFGVVPEHSRHENELNVVRRTRWSSLVAPTAAALTASTTRGKSSQRLGMSPFSSGSSGT